MGAIEQEAHYRLVVDALPIPILIVDHDVTALDANGAALLAFRLDQAQTVNKRGGQLLGCLHAGDVPEGCGRGPSCGKCQIRGTVNESFQAQAPVRRRARMEVLRDGRVAEAELLITASPLGGGSGASIVMIEDLAEISQVSGLITLCMQCKSVKLGQQWQRVERYFGERLGVEFSHGICPACRELLYPETLPGRHSATSAQVRQSNL